ncbi:SLC13 family permease [Sorangium sp. So ce726]|uniref:SLC13 family permease n=1 Tax=Sorangium sp. So ce726 TaxID=3133319 RepID=UPI003F62A656
MQERPDHAAAPQGAPQRGRPPPARLSLLRCLGVASGPAAALAIALVPSGLHAVPGFGHRPAYAAAVAAWMALWWLFEVLPVALTACLPLVLFPLLGVFGRGLAGDAARAAAPFVDAYIFLFLGGMAIGAAMEQWSLHRRVALHIMRAVGTDPKRLLLGMLVATSSISLWISNTATAVMMLPIGLALLAQLESAAGGRRLSHYGTAIMLAVAYASNVGGIGTKIGTGTNSIFCGFLADKLGYDLGFLQYMVIALPFVVLFVPLLWLALWRVGKRDGLGPGHARDALDRELAAMGPMSRGEKTVAAIFAAASALWILGDPLRAALAPRLQAALEGLGAALGSGAAAGFKVQGKHYEATVAVLAALGLLALRALSLASLRRMPWGTLALLGGSFAMAAGIEGGGLSAWMAAKLAVVAEAPLLAQLGLASAGTIALSALASNTATVNVALNVLPQDLGVLFAATIAASCDFMLPAGTPPNAIVFGSGYVRLPVMIRTGFLLNVAAAALITVYVYGYARHLIGG